MALINPHINFNGNAEEAFTFYKSVFGGEFTKIMRFKDISSPEFTIAEDDADKLMHIALSIGNNTLMGNDVPSFLGTVNEHLPRDYIVDNLSWGPKHLISYLKHKGLLISNQNVDDGLALCSVSVLW